MTVHFHCNKIQLTVVGSFKSIAPEDQSWNCAGFCMFLVTSNPLFAWRRSPSNIWNPFLQRNLYINSLHPVSAYIGESQTGYCVYSCRRVGFTTNFSCLYEEHWKPMIKLFWVHCHKQVFWAFVNFLLLTSVYAVAMFHCPFSVDSCVFWGEQTFLVYVAAVIC